MNFNHQSPPPFSAVTDHETNRVSQSLHADHVSQAQQSAAVPYASNRRLTTEEFARELGLKAQSIRKRYSQTGSYFDIKPIKLPNGRLRWLSHDVKQLLRLDV